MKLISCKIPETLDRDLARLAKQRKTSRSAVIREALESFTRRPNLSFTQAASQLVGFVDGPGDLSTNPKHMEGYGE